MIEKFIGNDNKYNGNYVGGVNSKLRPVFHFQSEQKITYTVKDRSELFEAINRSKDNDIIFIKGDSEINLTNVKPIDISKKITILSDRGLNNSLGAKLYTNSTSRPLLRIITGGVKIIGLRLDGGDYNALPVGVNTRTYKGKIAYIRPVTEAIYIAGQGVEIMNCEIYGWSHAGIFVEKDSKNIMLHYNYIHNNRREGLGYGIGLNGANVEVVANLFVNNRHDIAGTGIRNTSYIAKYNIIIGDKDDHSFDMHGGKDRKDGTNIAGSKIDIENNKFIIRKGTRAFVIRGIPTEYAIFKNNNVYEVIGNTKSNSLRKGALKGERIIHGVVGQRNSSSDITVIGNKKYSDDTSYSK